MGVASWMVVGLIASSLLLGGAGEAADPVLVLGAGALCALGLSARSLRPLSGTALGVVGAWLALAWIQGRSDAHAAVAVLAPLCVFCVAHTRIPRSERERLLAVLGGLGACVAALALYVMTPGSVAEFPMHSADGLGGWLVLPALLGVAALCLCAPQGRGARWTIAWFAVVSLCAAGIAATQSVAALLAIGAAAAVLLALRHLPSRRGLTAATAVGGLAILSLAPAIGAPTGDAFAAAGFGPSPLGLSGADPLARVAALLLSAALVLRRIRPLRLGRGSLAAWGGVAAVFGVACLGLVSSVLEVPAIGLTAAALAGLAWPNAVGSDAGSLRRTRAVLFLLTSGAFGAGVLHLLWGGVFVS